MATEVLRPHDCLTQRLRFPRRKSYQTAPALNPSYTKPNRRQQQSTVHDNLTNNRKNRAQSEPSALHRSKSDPDNLETSRNALDMQKVTVLKRGESLDSKLNTVAAFKRPDPNVYAGSAFVVSPEPCDLPLPSFSKKQLKEENATRDLRRLLGLN